MLFLMLLASDPVPGPIKAFGDWVVACDNLRSCEMTSLVPGDGMEADEAHSNVSLSIARAAGPAGAFTVEVGFNRAESGEATLIADGEVIAGAVPKGDSMRFTGVQAARIVAALIKAKELKLIDIGGAEIGLVSLAGSSAALRFIDAEQGRSGTVSAAVAKGGKPAAAVPGAAAGPAIRFVRPGGKAVPITAALKRAMLQKARLKASDCSDGSGENPDIEAYAIGGGATLALLPCGAGAYNFMTVPFVIRGGKPVVAGFDFAPGMDKGSTVPMLVNAGWDARTARLSSYSKGRGLGDCGSSEDYVWDGAGFRLVEARQMIECRGSANWLTVFKAATLAQ